MVSSSGSSSQSSPPPNNGNGDSSSGEGGGATAESALKNGAAALLALVAYTLASASSGLVKLGAAVAALALLALGAYSLASSSPSHSGDGDSGRKGATATHTLPLERAGGGGTVDDDGDHGPCAVAGSALLTLGASTLDSSSSSHDGDGDGGLKMVTYVKPEGCGSGVNNNRDHAPFAGCSQLFASKKIKVMSYNIWSHGEVGFVKRMVAIGELIEEESPDIIFFQDVTRNTCKVFEGSNWWGEYRCCLDPSERGRSYFFMLLSKLPVTQFMCDPHEYSNRGKGICVAEIDAGTGKNLVVATSHLKRPNPPEMSSMERVTRAKDALGRLNSEPNVIFGGDMDWDEAWDGHFPLLPGWHDAWSVLRPGENGWTYDTRSNMMLKGNQPLQTRPDRFVCKLRDFSMTAVDMIGMDAIPMTACISRGKILPILPSDHYGLLLTIRPVQYRMG